MSWLQYLIIDSHNKGCACYVYSFSQKQLQTGKDGCDLVKFSAAFFGSHIYSELDDILTVLLVLVELLLSGRKGDASCQVLIYVLGVNYILNSLFHFVICD